MNFDEPIRLKADDAPSPAPDLQGVAIQLMATLRILTDDSGDLVKTLRGWGDDPISAHRRAQGRSIELSEAAGRALDLGEQLIQAFRLAGSFSAQYTAEFGGRDGR